jgi:hypothetical protein
MWFNQFYQGWRGRFRSSRNTKAPASPRRGMRPGLDQLEDRMLPSSYTAATVSELIADINAANKAGGTNTITLTAPTTSPYILNNADNKTDGPTGLPVISGGNKADNLTIVGNGDTIERSTASGTPDFRLFDVASGASLTLEKLTLQNGLEDGSGSSAQGGAIYNQGSLTLSGVTVQGNSAVGSSGANAQNPNQNGSNGQDAAGGGVWSNGTLTVENGTLIQNNEALGGNGGNASFRGGFAGISNSFGGNGGNASGGGVYIAGGTANLTGVTFSGNLARGGVGGEGFIAFFNAVEHAGTAGDGFGGGLSVGGGSVALCSDTVQNNEAQGGLVTVFSPNPGVGLGGGIYIASAATVHIDSFTVANTINNSDSSGLNGPTANIDGTYILKNC